MKTIVSIELEIPHPDGAIPVEVWGEVWEVVSRCDTDRGAQELVLYVAEVAELYPPNEYDEFVLAWMGKNISTVEQKLIEAYKNQPERA